MGNTNMFKQELTSTPITEFIKVTAGDIDNLAYFSGSVGLNKEIRYYDYGMNFLYKEVFEYVSTSQTTIKYIKKVNDLYLGLYDATDGFPTITTEGAYYTIAVGGTIAGITYSINDTIMLLDGSIQKVIFNSVNRKWQAV